jgi:hypothetical protein
MEDGTSKGKKKNVQAGVFDSLDDDKSRASSPVNELLKRVKTTSGDTMEKVEIVDPEKIIKRGPIYVLHTMLSWAIMDEVENPIWVCFRNRRAINKMVCIFITNCNGQLMNEAVKDGRLSSLQNFHRSSNHIDLHFNGFESSVRPVDNPGHPVEQMLPHANRVDQRSGHQDGWLYQVPRVHPQ